ncbi:aspartyl protease family protein [Pedobacter duraquae]|uniref:Aspartyl protease n=1 Tax=Pedobacter duraquae TaxID=425511 RepID=A0A4R6IAJ8_9SPHI|nr:aspartyl protease family protein [Pedobacter duraquae]TDO19220.1 aspartyl protease [Pedobacter duraquae]
MVSPKNHYGKGPLKAILIILITVHVLSVPSYAQEFKLKGNRKKERISFRLIKNLIVIPVYINKKGPYNFILDTGVGAMLITDPSILDSLQFSKLRKVKVGGAGNGEDLDAYISIILETQIGHATLTYTPAAILEEDFFSLSNYLGTPIHGLVGSYFFNSFVVKLKYSTRSITFYKHDVPFRRKGIGLPIELILNKPYIDLSVQTQGMEPRKSKLLMDSGASNSLSLEILDGKKYPLPAYSIPANLGVGFGGLVTGNIARAPLVSIGPYEIKNTLVSYPDYEGGPLKALRTGRNGIIGADILSRFDIIMDYENHVFFFKPNQNFKKPFEHDMSGLEIYQSGEGLKDYMIGRIEKGSPAELEGVQIGDEILGVNLHPVAELDLEAINDFLKAGDGRKCILKLFRDGEVVYKIITLKKRI